MNLQQLEGKLHKVPSRKRSSGKSKNDYRAIEMGQKIIEARIARGMTQETLAKKIGTQQPSIARIERGASMPTMTMLFKIALALNMNLELPRFEGVGKSANKDTANVQTKVTIGEFQEIEVGVGRI